MKKELQITCPECGHEFSPEKAIEGHLRAHLEKEYADKLATTSKQTEERIKASVEEEFKSKIDLMEEDKRKKNLKIKELETKSLDFAKKEEEMEEIKSQLDMKVERQLIEERKKIRAEAEKTAMEKAEMEYLKKKEDLQLSKKSIEMNANKAAAEQIDKVRTESDMRIAEMQKKVEATTQMAQEMKRKAEQGSMQLQGEVQELVIEEYLKAAFPQDEVQEIAKGTKGGDCIHIVKDNYAKVCGTILYESKRTAAFSHKWVTKVKEDMRLKQADMGIIVTEAMPKELNRFGQIDGVWICSASEFKSVSMLMRYTFIRIGEVIATQDNKGDKMKMLYDYLTGNEFCLHVDAIREGFEQMHTDLLRERNQAMTNFAKREKQITKVLEHTVALYGDVRGIAGGAIKTIASLEIGELPGLQKAS